MRLIDADKIEYIAEIDDRGNEISPPMANPLSIDLMPSIDAIPRRWIKVWGRRNNQKEIIKQLLDDWSKFKQKQ